MPRKAASIHIDNAAAVGARLRQARQAAGLSQRQLSFDGCTPAYISRIEAGARVPSLQLLREFARQLGVSADYLATGREVGEPDNDSALLHAELMLQTGDLESARRAYTALAEAGGERISSAATAGLGQLAFREGDHARAITLLEEALESRGLGPRPRTAATETLGRALVLAGSYDEALAVFERALSEARERKDVAETIRFAVLLGNTLIDRGSFPRAEEVLAELLELARETHEPVTRASVFWSQSRLHSSEGRPDMAARYARQALETLEVTEHTVYTAKALLLLAQMENQRGNAREALELVDQASPALALAGSPYERGLLLLEKARSLAALGEREEALATALGTIALFGDSTPRSAGRGYAIAAALFAGLGDDAHAGELYELALETLPAEDRHRIDALSGYAELLERTGRKDEAFDVLKQAVQIQTRLGIQRG